MIDVLLLAGGESSRFWPFTDKILTPFFGKPLLSWHYDQLVRVGCRRVVVVTNKASHESIAGVVPPKKLTVEYIVQSGSGQGNAVMSAAGKFGEKQPVLILNASDIYEDELIRSIWDAHRSDPQSVHMAAIRVGSYFPGGYLRLDNGAVKEIVEKPKEGKEPSDIVKQVVDVVPDIQAFCNVLKPLLRYPNDSYERGLNKLIKAHVSAKPMITSSKWVYLKYPWHILTVMEMCLETIDGQHIDRSVKIGKHVVIEGPVIIEEGVKIGEGTKIVGPCYIGKRTIVGNNNLIRFSHLGSDCVTGFATDITRSYVGSGSWFHTNYIGDSVIGPDVSMGSGTVLANLRLDESPVTSTVKGELINTRKAKLGAMIGPTVRIGINVSIMPGVKIGTRSFVGAGVILAEDLADGMYCRTTPTVVISPNAKQAGGSRDGFKQKL